MCAQIKKRNAFTLIELIIVITVFSILAVFVISVYTVGLRVWSSNRDRTYLRQNANLAFERMVREISQASEINTAKSDEIKFEADLDQNGSVESITFDVNNDDQLQRTEDNVDVTLASDVEAFTLGYYLEGDNDILHSSVTGNDRDDIRVVLISLTLTDEDETVTLGTSAYTRNQGLDD